VLVVPAVPVMILVLLSVLSSSLTIIAIAWAYHSIVPLPLSGPVAVLVLPPLSGLVVEQVLLLLSDLAADLAAESMIDSLVASVAAPLSISELGLTTRVYI
jgi:hypothetical protein